MKLFLFLITALFWGGSYVAIHSVVQTVPPIEAAAARIWCSFLLIGILLKTMGKPLWVHSKHRKPVWLAGLFSQGIPFIFLFWGETKISAGLGGIINGTVPIWTALMGATLFGTGENLGFRKVTGLALGFLGLGVIFTPTLTLKGSSGELLGALSLVAMALCYGVGIQMNRKLITVSGSPDLMTNLFEQQVVSGFFLLAISWLSEGTPQLTWIHEPRALAAVLYMGWISSCLAFLIFYRLTREWGAVRTSTVTYLVPLFAMLLDFFINDAKPTLFEIMGILIVLTGTALVQGISLRRLLKGKRF